MDKLDMQTTDLTDKNIKKIAGTLPAGSDRKRGGRWRHDSLGRL
jgi:hypothetical protein